MKELAASILVGLCVIFGFSVIQSRATNRNEEALLAIREEIETLRQDLQAFLATNSGRSRMDEKMDERLAASNIVSDLRTMKAAAMMFHSDNIDGVQMDDVSVKSLIPYLEPKFDSPVYLLHIGDGAVRGRRWWVGFDLKAAGQSESVRELLRGRANSFGLYASPDLDTSLI